LWRNLTGDLEFDSHELQLLEAVCRTLDTISILQAQVDVDGVMALGSQGQPVVHPAVAELRQQRATMARLLGQLGIPNEDGAGGTVESMETVRARRAAQERWRQEGARNGA
jgi:hypothetical protein